ncbi:MAG: tetratricopeptide repeat protein [Deltaproteobacteria bacterium]
MKKYVFAILISLFLFYPSHGFAETKEIISEGAYNMGDGETPGVAENRAMLNAKRTALEQAGTYVESYSKVINLQLTEDEIQVLASGLMEVEIVDKKRTIVGDGFRFWIKIKVKVYLDKTMELANRIKPKDKSFVEDYKKIQEAYDKTQRDIEELKRQLKEALGEKEKKQVKAKIAVEERSFEAKGWFDKGYQHGLSKEYDKEVEAYTNAIALNPNYGDAYYNRGLAYYDKGQYDIAIEDYTSAIAINPNYGDAYYNRGLAYYNKALYDRAIEDYTSAIVLDPNAADAIYNRGLSYQQKGNMGRAIPDYQKACDLGFKIACDGLQKALKKK